MDGTEIFAVIDLRDNEDAIVAKLRVAMEHGAFYVVGHQVDDVGNVTSALRQFFAAPLEHKIAASSRSKEEDPRGYRPCRGTDDWTEKFSVGPDSFADGPPGAEWPSDGGSLRAALGPYFAAMTALSTNLLLLLTQAAGIPADAWAQFQFAPTARSVRYRLPEAAASGVARAEYPSSDIGATSTHGGGGAAAGLRLPAHTDSGLFTFILQDDPHGSLEVYSRVCGKWLAATACPDGLLVTLGDSFTIATNGAAYAVPHRVLVPSPPAGAPAGTGGDAEAVAGQDMGKSILGATAACDSNDAERTPESRISVAYFCKLHPDEIVRPMTEMSMHRSKFFIPTAPPFESVPGAVLVADAIQPPDEAYEAIQYRHLISFKGMVMKRWPQTALG